MQHTSIKVNSPIEIIDVTPLNPLISKCQIKVCYVGDEPNRNGSVITKAVAMDMANHYLAALLLVSTMKQKETLKLTIKLLTYLTENGVLRIQLKPMDL